MAVKTQEPLPAPARYYPLEKGLYEVAPGLRTFGSDFGNGNLDNKVFQFDSSFEVFRESKLACRAERLSKYYCEANYTQTIASHVSQTLIELLVKESPEHFAYEQLADGRSRLVCRLTSEILFFDADLNLSAVESQNGAVLPPYQSTFDALAMQVQEDLNIMAIDETGEDRLCAMHLCSPSSWRAEEKIGKNFVAVHSPVADNGPLLRVARGIVNAMVHKGPYVRFVWGLTTNPQPNHHPDPPPGVDREIWRGKPLTSIAQGTKAYMWVERQVVWGIPTANASLFTIRASFISLDAIRGNERERELFKSTMQSMSEAVRDYKGIAEAFDSVMTWLEC